MSGPGPLPSAASPPGLATARLVGVAGIATVVASGAGLALGIWLGGADADATTRLGVGGAVGSTVGAAVGGDVGGGVGRGVAGGAVGGGVGVGAAVAAWTTIDPCMVGWIEQWYAKVPATPNGIVRLLAPGASWPVSNAFVSDVAVWVV